MKSLSGHALLSVIGPSLYLLMYFPIWDGKELVLSNAFATTLFVFQYICLILAILQLLLVNLRSSDSGLLNVVFGFFFVGSLVLTCFFGFFFMLELFAIPWFPAQN